MMETVDEYLARGGTITQVPEHIDPPTRPPSPPRPGTMAWNVWEYLAMRGAPMRQCDLAQELAVAPENLSRMLTRLVRGGFVERPERGVYLVPG